jgi:hypothetical protein
MYIATLFFLGIAASIVMALTFFRRSKRANTRVEVDLDALRAASICISGGRRMGEGGAAKPEEPTMNEKERWHAIKLIWVECYSRCQEEAIIKQRAMLSWARTCALCAVLCLVGVLLEVEFGEFISIDSVVQNFGHSYSAATISKPSPARYHQSKPAQASRSPR